ncbi:MAG: ImmA/IrrE family metallo-endopeptidase [Cyclobacteriaceae bacterium]
MALSKEYKKLIFGIKLREYRNRLKYSLQQLSQSSGVSVSYLNEIEKGKKYPKPDKIEHLAKALNVESSELVSERLDNKLSPLVELLHSGILSELPLEMFGLEPGKLLELLSNAPSKLNAFIGTLLEISRNYDLRVETFYFSVMRSYQEIHNNYFEDLERAAERFIEDYKIDINTPLTTRHLENLLGTEFNYKIIYDSFEDNESLSDMRSIMKPAKRRKPRFILNSALNSRQRGFNMAREIGHAYLGLTDRTLTSPWVDVSSFDQVLNNFKASYFASAILINRKGFLKDLERFFAKSKWQPEILIDTMMQYNATPEMVMQRMTNLLPQYFGFKELFFFRFHNKPFSGTFNLSKELHIAREHTPRGTVLQEHFCRRWMFISILDQLAENQKADSKAVELGGAQIDRYHETGEEFLVLSLARALSPTPGVNSSLALGIRIDEHVREKVRFLSDPSIDTQIVNDTCERCNVADCEQRVAEPNVYRELKKEKDRRQALKNYGK